MSTYKHAFCPDFFLKFPQPVVNAFETLRVCYIKYK